MRRFHRLQHVIEDDHAGHHRATREVPRQAGMIMWHDEIHKRVTQILG
ncbi:hypothetical protein XGA_3675 [Xanthomonas hortorum ATCC 19865]|nr:hypothetical protein XGA_3675 [Xanthomonas hortorum ATCC 19865]